MISRRIRTPSPWRPRCSRRRPKRACSHGRSPRSGFPWRCARYVPSSGRIGSGPLRGCRMFRIWVPDLDSPSYFVAIAAVELDLFKQEGIDVEFVYDTMEGPELMRGGKLDFIGGPPFVGPRAFSPPESVKVLRAL